jgi:hypothetical protein
MLAYGHVADASGNPSLPNLGDHETALAFTAKPSTSVKSSTSPTRPTSRAATDHGIVLSRVETVMDDAESQAKILAQQESLKVLSEAAKIDPTNTALRLYRALELEHLGDTYSGETAS